MYPRMQGVTLVEALVVLVIVAVLTMLAAPSFVGMLQQMRTAAATNDLLASMALARSEAVRRGGRMVLCVAATPTSCATTGSWQNGWLLFHDKNSNGVVDAAESVVQYHAPLAAEMVARGNSPVARYISYTGFGRSALLSGAIQAGTVYICHRSAQPVDGRSIVLNASGRARTSTWKPGVCS